MNNTNSKVPFVLATVAISAISLCALSFFIAALHLITLGAMKKEDIIIICGIILFLFSMSFLAIFILKMKEIFLKDKSRKASLLFSNIIVSFVSAVFVVVVIIVSYILSLVEYTEPIYIAGMATHFALILPLISLIAFCVCSKIIYCEQKETSSKIEDKKLVKPKRKNNLVSILLISCCSIAVFVSAIFFTVHITLKPTKFSTDLAYCDNNSTSFYVSYGVLRLTSSLYYLGKENADIRLEFNFTLNGEEKKIATDSYNLKQKADQSFFYEYDEYVTGDKVENFSVEIYINNIKYDKTVPVYSEKLILWETKTILSLTSLVTFTVALGAIITVKTIKTKSKKSSILNEIV